MGWTLGAVHLNNMLHSHLEREELAELPTDT